MGAPDPTLSSLTPAERNLVRLMQSIGCGRLRNLAIREGQPTFEAPLTAVRLVRLRRSRSMQSQTVTGAASADFGLRREVLDLLAQIRAMKYGTVERLEILDGLPTAVEIAEPLAMPTSLCPTSTPTSVR